MYGTTAQFGGASGEVFSALCGMQIPRFTASKPSNFAFASDEKSIRRPTTSFVRCRLKIIPNHAGTFVSLSNIYKLLDLEPHPASDIFLSSNLSTERRPSPDRLRIRRIA